MALEIVPQEYFLSEKVRLSLLPPPPPEGFMDQELTALQAVQYDHPFICAGTPRSAAARILKLLPEF